MKLAEGLKLISDRKYGLKYDDESSDDDYFHQTLFIRKYFNRYYECEHDGFPTSQFSLSDILLDIEDWEI